MMCVMKNVVNKIVRTMKGVTNKDNVNIMKGVVNNLQFQDELYVN